MQCFIKSILISTVTRQGNVYLMCSELKLKVFFNEQILEWTHSAFLYRDHMGLKTCSDGFNHQSMAGSELQLEPQKLTLRQIPHFRECTLTFECVEGELQGLSVGGVVSVLEQRCVCALVILQTLLCCWLLFMQLLEDGCCLEVDLI